MPPSAFTTESTEARAADASWMSTGIATPRRPISRISLATSSSASSVRASTATAAPARASASAVARPMPLLAP